MAKEITISMADSQFETLQEAYAKNDDSVAVTAVLYQDGDVLPEDKEVGDVKIPAVDEAYVKGRLVSILKAKVRNYDDAEQEVSYSTFEPS
jgi:hypothetical protein